MASSDRLDFLLRINSQFEGVSKITTQLDSVIAQLDKIASKGVAVNKAGGDGFRRQEGIAAFAQNVGATADALQDAVGKAGALSDKVAIFQKNANLSKEEAAGIVSELGKLDTRTSLEDRIGIAQMAGKFNVAKSEIADFVRSVDMVNVGLGDEFGNNAEAVAVALGRLKSQFKETESLKFGDALQRVGSMVNFLGKQMQLSTPEVLEFMKRTSIQNLGVANTAAIGGVLNSAGLSAEIAAGGMTAIFTAAKNESADFAKHLGMTKAEVEKLINTKPNEFILKLAASFKTASSTQIGQTLKQLKISSQESGFVMQLLSRNLDQVKQAQVMANYEFQNGKDIQGEANLMNSTLGASIAKTKDKIDQVVGSVGAVFAPYSTFIQLLAFSTVAMQGVVAAGSLLYTGLLMLGKGLWGAAAAVGRFTLSLLTNAAVMVGTVIKSVFAAAAAMLTALVPALGGTSMAMTVFNLVMSLNPIGFVIMLIGLLAAGFVYLWYKVGSFTEAIGIAWNFILQYNPFSILIKSLDYLFGTAMFDRVKSFFDWAFYYIGKMWDQVKGFFDWLGSAEQSMGASAADMVAGGGSEVGGSQALADKTLGKLDLAIPKELQNMLGGLGATTTDTKAAFNTKLLDEANAEEERKKQKQAAQNAGISSGLAGVAGGGQKNITINIQKFLENITLQSQTVQEGAADIERVFTNLFLRVVNSANQME